MGDIVRVSAMNLMNFIVCYVSRASNAELAGLFSYLVMLTMAMTRVWPFDERYRVRAAHQN